MKKLYSVLIIIFSFQISFAQPTMNGSSTNPQPDYVYRNEQKRQEMREIHGQDEKGMILPPKESPRVMSSEEAKRQRENAREKIIRLAEINAKFSVPKEYRSKYENFLKEKNTGIARMFPDAKCDGGVTVSVTELERCANTPQIRGNGSLYSIKLMQVPSNYPLDLILALIRNSDMYYSQGKLMIGNSTTQGIISEIGDVNLETLDLKSAPFKFLRELKPTRNKKDLTAHRLLLEKGIESNGFTYTNVVQPKLNSTYVFRSIAFSARSYKSFWESDMLVAFKVVGMENDGSIIFIWKKLKQKESPSFEF